MSILSTTIDRLKAKAGVPVASTTAAPAAESTPVQKAEPMYFVYINGANANYTETQIQELAANGGGDTPAVLQSEAAGGWKKVSDYVKTVATAPLAPPAAPLAPAAPAAPAAPEAPVVTPATTVVPVTTITPATTVVPATQVIVATPETALSAPATFTQLPTTVTSDNAMAILSNLLQTAGPGAVSVASLVSETAEEGGAAHTLPYAQLKKSNWNIPKATATEIADFMPAGNRAFTAIYLAHRIGATGWVGAGSKEAAKAPPAWNYALPTPAVNAQAQDFITETIRQGRRVQMTKADDRVKFDAAGRITPTLHVLVWKANVGFMILDLGTYNSVTESTPGLAEADQHGWRNAPCSFTIETLETVNKKVAAADPNAKNAKWTTDYLKVSADASHAGHSLKQAWVDYVTRNKEAAAETILGFHNAKDYNGLSLEEVAKIFQDYNSIVDAPRG